MPTRPKLWLELFRLELLYVDKVRARRAVLGIADDDDLPDDDDDDVDNGTDHS
jgi:U3 small nucleolar RNA-associated protein 6